MKPEIPFFIALGADGQTNHLIVSSAQRRPCIPRNSVTPDESQVRCRIFKIYNNVFLFLLVRACDKVRKLCMVGMLNRMSKGDIY